MHSNPRVSGGVKEVEMMRKLLSIGFSLLIPVLAVISWARLQPRALYPWQELLDAYLNFQVEHNGLAFEIIEANQAQNPWRFRDDSTPQSYAYLSSYNTTDLESSRFGASISLSYFPSVMIGDGRAPIPYPVQELWCVLLQTREEPVYTTVVYMGLHKDLYNAGWIVHEEYPDLPVADALRKAKTFGCQLDYP